MEVPTRFVIPHPDYTVLVGYADALKSYYVAVAQGSKTLFWRGTGIGEIETLEEIQMLLSMKFNISIPENIATQLNRLAPLAS
jgi:hypothetical protein